MEHDDKNYRKINKLFPQAEVKNRQRKKITNLTILYICQAESYLNQAKVRNDKLDFIVKYLALLQCICLHIIKFL